MTALAILAALVAFGCAIACARRLYYTTHSLALHPRVWLAAIERGEGESAARAAREDPHADWEHELLDAAEEKNENVRTARINELLIDLDFRLGRWERVPRVCASVASSAGFLFGSLMLRFGLLATNVVMDDARGDAINAVVLSAVNVAALGIAGASFAIASQYRARTLARAFHRDAEALISVLENPSS